MSVYQRPTRTGGMSWSANFVLIGPDGKRHRFRPSLGPKVTTKAEAEREEARLRVELEKQLHAISSPEHGPTSTPKPATETLATFADRWLRHVALHQKPSTLRLYSIIVEQWIKPEIGAVPLLDLDAARLDAWKAWAKEKHPPRGPKWLNECLGCLSSMLARAVKWRALPANPCDQVERFSVPPATFDYYTEAESDHWLRKCAEIVPSMHALFFVGFRTGLREGELFALQWTDLDLTNARLHVQRSITRGRVDGVDVRVETPPKSGKARWVDLHDDTVAVLRAHKHPGARVFQNREGGVWTREAIVKPWHRVTRAAELRDITPHGMRHSFASQLVTAGAPLVYVQHQLGHSTSRMTERYAHLSPTGKRWVSVLGGSKAGPHTKEEPS